MKEYLIPGSGRYTYIQADNAQAGWIEIPEGSTVAFINTDENKVEFVSHRSILLHDTVVWQRDPVGEIIDGLTAFNLVAQGTKVEYDCRIRDLWDEEWYEFTTETEWSINDLVNNKDLVFRVAPIAYNEVKSVHDIFKKSEKFRICDIEFEFRGAYSKEDDMYYLEYLFDIDYCFSGDAEFEIKAGQIIIKPEDEDEEDIVLTLSSLKFN